MRWTLAALVALLWMNTTALANDALTVRDVIERQLAALARGDAAEAYSYAAPEARRAMPTPDDFLRMVRNSYQALIQPKSLSFRDLRISRQLAIQHVRIVDKQGVGWTAIYGLSKQADGSWKIGTCQLLPDEFASLSIRRGF